MIEFEEYKGKLHDLHPKLDDLGQSLNIEGAKNELERYHACLLYTSDAADE